MESKYLCAIVCVALACMTGVTSIALFLGINGAVLSTVIGVFGVIIGAVAKTIYEKGKLPGK